MVLLLAFVESGVILTGLPDTSHTRVPCGDFTLTWLFVVKAQQRVSTVDVIEGGEIKLDGERAPGGGAVGSGQQAVMGIRRGFTNSSVFGVIFSKKKSPDILWVS